MRQIPQGVTQASLFLELQKWCRQGAGAKGQSLHFMSAFASGAGIQSLEPFLDVFLSDGNSIEIVVGIDRGGTSRDAIKTLLELQNSHPAQFSCKVFHAPSRTAIFHPKIYLYKTSKFVSAVVGSGNLTLGGLAHNFESLYLFRNLPHSSLVAREILATWNTFAMPRPPLRETFLRPLSRSYAQQLYKKLPNAPALEKFANKEQSSKGIQSLWRPISSIKLPRSKSVPRRRDKIPALSAKRILIVDVLNETRGTQMQLPLAVVEEFFDIQRDKPAKIALSQVRGGELTQPIERPIVISSGANGKRLMRRIEMPQIKGLKRPLAAVFLRLGNRRFASVLLVKGSKLCNQASRFLDKSGQQPTHATRRYHIGIVGSSAGVLLREAVKQS